MPRRDNEEKEREEAKKLFELEREEMGDLEINEDPLNIAREVTKMIELSGDKAAEKADFYARIFAERGYDEKAADWLEVRRIIASLPPKPSQTN